MKSLKEVLNSIEAFKKDMEELGVDVEVSIAGDPEKISSEKRVTLLAIVKLELGENLEED